MPLLLFLPRSTLSNLISHSLSLFSLSLSHTQKHSHTHTHTHTQTHSQFYTHTKTHTHTHSLSIQTVAFASAVSPPSVSPCLILLVSLFHYFCMYRIPPSSFRPPLFTSPLHSPGSVPLLHSNIFLSIRYV